MRSITPHLDAQFAKTRLSFQTVQKSYPDKSVLGNQNNVSLEVFTTIYVGSDGDDDARVGGGDGGGGGMNEYQR